MKFAERVQLGDTRQKQAPVRVDRGFLSTPGKGGRAVAEEKKKRETVGRFAPSPSGRMHLGNAFCALGAWLAARAAGGRVILRQEDLDTQRCRPEYARQLEDDLKWLGLSWDEGGFDAAGPRGPYRQSARGGVYQECFDTLRAQGLCYPCFCSRGELHAAGAPHRSDGVPIYDGRCRALSVPERRAVLSRGKWPAWRLRTPDRVQGFTDGLQGPYEENLERDCGDFILRRSDGVWAYQLAVVADDGLMGVTQVVRGRDLLDSTPRQLYLYRLLGLEPPEFFHLPLLLAPGGRRLSKRDGDLDLGALRARFGRPQALVGRMAWLMGLLDRPEAVDARELIGQFRWDRIPREDIVTKPEVFWP